VRFRLIPRDEGFYPLFEQQAAHAASTAVQLEKLMKSLPVLEDRVDSIVAAERAGDAVMRQVRSRLETSIVTPFDREDIQNLANHLDDVLDEMRAAADLAQVHQVSTPLPGVSDLVALLRQIAEVNVELIGKLPTLKQLNDVIDRIDTLEREADAVFRRVMGELFNGAHAPLDILKWKDVIEAIERAINAVQDASGVVESIAVKHA